MPGARPGMTQICNYSATNSFAFAIQLSTRAGQTDFLADLLGIGRSKLGQLRVVEYAEVVELLLDRARHAGQLLEIVGDAARAGQRLEAGRRHFGGKLLDHRRFGCTGIDAEIALRARNAVDRGLRDEIAIKRDRAAGIVVAGDHKGDPVRIAVGVDDRGDRNVQAARLFQRDVFLVGVDHEQQVGQAAHLLDAAERAVELFLLARERQALFLGVAGRRFGRAQHLLELAQPLDRGRDRLPVGQRTAEPARIDVILRAPFGGVGDCVLRLAFRADEQDAAALGDRIAHRLQRAVHHRHRLGEIEDVDIVAGPEDVLRHLRIPAVGLMAEVHASFQKLTHRIVRKRHIVFSGCSAADPRATSRGFDRSTGRR